MQFVENHRRQGIAPDQVDDHPELAETDLNKVTSRGGLTPSGNCFPSGGKTPGLDRIRNNESRPGILKSDESEINRPFHDPERIAPIGKVNRKLSSHQSRKGKPGYGWLLEVRIPPVRRLLSERISSLFKEHFLPEINP